MIKLSLKTISLLSMVLVSSNIWANSPFALEEEAAAAANQNEPEATNEDTFRSPAYTEEANTETQAPVEQRQTVVTQTQGDVLAQPVATRFLDFPRRGMSTDKVQNELGRPGEIIPAIGEPPISRWVYDDRIVYFEFSSVIHVVAR